MLLMLFNKLLRRLSINICTLIQRVCPKLPLQLSEYSTLSALSLVSMWYFYSIRLIEAFLTPPRLAVTMLPTMRSCCTRMQYKNLYARSWAAGFRSSKRTRKILRPRIRSIVIRVLYLLCTFLFPTTASPCTASLSTRDGAAPHSFPPVSSSDSSPARSIHKLVSITQEKTKAWVRVLL